jgi:hypothetical protein
MKLKTPGAMIPAIEIDGFTEWYEQRAKECISPIPADDLNDIHWVATPALSEIWEADLEAEARRRYFDDEDADDEVRQLARVRYYDDLKAAQLRLSLPQVYVRKLAQIPLDLYPNRRLQDYDRWTTPSAESEYYDQDPLGDGPSGFWRSVHINEEDYFAFRQRRCFDEVRAWLAELPIPQHQEVYLAWDDPHHTQVMRWSTMVNHWDFFAPPSGIYTANVIDDTAQWLLLYYTERTACFVCTDAYAAKHNVCVDTFLPRSEDLLRLVGRYQTDIRNDRANRDFQELLTQKNGVAGSCNLDCS